MATIKLLGNSTALGSATNLGNATFVRVVNTNAAEQTVTIANTADPVNGGGTPGTVVIEAGQSEIIVKEPTDTIASVATVFGTKVARY
jgi:hypothetical protein